MRDDGTGPVGFKTHDNRGQFLHLAFTQLRELGFKVANILSFNQKHLKALFALWIKQKQDSGTIANYRSMLAVYTKAIGKGGMVPVVKDLGTIGVDPSEAKRATVARVDKSWTAEEFAEGSKAAHLLDSRYGHIFDLIGNFGLRSKEGCMIEPHVADRGTHLHLALGTKGGRPRDVPIDTPEKRQTIDRAKSAVLDISDSVSGKTVGLRATMTWYRKFNRKLGATKSGKFGKTPHGLRHRYAHDELMKRGVSVSVKGAAGIPVDAPVLTRAQIKAARLEVAEAMGHARVTVTGAYSGTLKARGENQNPINAAD